ncbi:MAG: phosphoribosylformylglycinamidine synthase subunit PurL [Anaerolineae bacterium]|nr:phosphoribosylformylglycinamidine synthase subunit PurL [Anaerolineae bacterium]
MEYRIEVNWQADVPDGRVTDLLAQIAQLGLSQVRSVQVSDLYFVRGELTHPDLEQLAQELLADPVVEGYHAQALTPPPSPLPSPNPGRGEGAGGRGEDPHVVEVGFHPGVTDPVAENLLQRAHLLGIGTVEATSTGKRYVFEGDLTEDDLRQIAEQVLCNDVIQTYALGTLPPSFVPRAEPSDLVEIIPIRKASDEALAKISVERVLFLSLDEMKTIQDYFNRLGRDPTDVELETLAQTWSEHCQHKAFKSKVDYECKGGMPRVLSGVGRIVNPPYKETIDGGMFRTYLRAATERLEPEWVLSVFVDNAGVIEFDDEYEISFKVETHNHPSALEPFGGANTGIGGVIRDVIGVSARPIANTDVLCFGPLDMAREDMPGGILHPHRIARGVVDGIEDYGNKMGIPTVSGAILYDPGYAANPLVYCGCVGLARKGQRKRDPQPGDLCVTLGGRTGRDGIHGATFSSAELTHETGQTVGSVVQIGDPITEKAMLEAVMIARDEELYTAINDCGAGGFSSAAGEIGEEIGVEIELSDVRLKYPGLRPWEIWLSEAQERMVLAVPSNNLPRLREICDGLDVELTVIGHYTGNGRLRVKYGGKMCADLDMEFVHNGWPQPNLQAVWEDPDFSKPDIPQQKDLTPVLLRMLADADVASKEPVIRRYDHEIQAATVVKPLVGVKADGPSDGAVLRPLAAGGYKGLALGCGISPYYGQIDPYAMAWAVVDEAVRNIVAVGANPDRIAVLDNFCWGSPSIPDRMGGLVRAAQGCHDAALAYGTPFVSGKDSLNNEYVDPQGVKRPIPPTLLISSMGIVPDVRQAVTMDLKTPGNWVYIVGVTRAELGASLYYRLHGGMGMSVPAPVPDAIETMRVLHSAMRQGLVRACHDLSEGGLAVAAAEMAFAGRLGLEIDLGDLPRTADVTSDAVALFSESCARFLVEVAPKNADAFEKALAGRPVAQIGQVTDDGALRTRGLEGNIVIGSSIQDLLRAWQGTEVV